MIKIKKYVNKVVKILSLNELRILPSYLSYNFVLSIIPTITIILFIASLFSISNDSLITLIYNITPNYVSNVIKDIISNKNYTFSVGLLNILTLYAASRGMYAVVESSNSLYKVPKRNITKDRLKSVLILLSLIVSLMVLLLIPVFGESVIKFLQKYDIITNNFTSIYYIFKWPITFFVILINVIFIYMISPSIKLSIKNVIVGALSTTILWNIFTALFGYYLIFFTRYNYIYGSLSSITILLIWIYFLSYILILGIVINTRLYNDN